MRELTDLTLTHHLDELAAFEPNGFPVVSLYLDARADQRGRDKFDSFVHKEFAARAKSFSPDSPARASFESDAARIRAYLREELRRSANGLAVFACAGAGRYFKAVQFDAPINRHRLHVAERPHLYPLARLIAQYPRYVALLADTNSARLFVFGLGRALGGDEVSGVKRTPEHEVLKATIEALGEYNTQTDAEGARRLLDQYKAGGLAVVGLRDTLTALYRGQVDELLLSASAREIRCDEEELEGTPAEDAPHDQLDLREREPHLVAADVLVARARLTGAGVAFIEDAALLAGVGGVGALLRYRL